MSMLILQYEWFNEKPTIYIKKIKNTSILFVKWIHNCDKIIPIISFPWAGWLIFSESSKRHGSSDIAFKRFLNSLYIDMILKFLV
jgi:hypothetical protein